MKREELALEDRIEDLELQNEQLRARIGRAMEATQKLYRAGYGVASIIRTALQED